MLNSLIVQKVRQKHDWGLLNKEENMSYQLPKSFKCCLTCTYWCGQRKLTMIETRVETDSETTKGMCANRNGFYHLDMNAMSTCSHHESMPALKD